jgi:hypothetical protein
MKCRFCGAILDQALLQQDAWKGHDAIIDNLASDSLKYSLIGILCFGFILGPMGAYKGYKALSEISETRNLYPAYPGNSSAQGKAIAGLIIGCIVLLLNVAGLMLRIAAAK